MNEGYDGNVNGIMGGTNPIFGVDGSPIVHDILSTGFNADGSVDDEKKWRTIYLLIWSRELDFQYTLFQIMKNQFIVFNIKRQDK